MPARGFGADLAARLRALPEGTVLQYGFRALVAATAVMLLTDIRDMSRRAGQAEPFGVPATAPVRMDRPKPNDQLRPYLPSTRPADPDDPVRARPRDGNESEPMTFRPGTGGAAFAEGTITPGTADAFAEFLQSARAADVSEIVLHSPGGSVADALAMGKLIRDKGLNTRVLPDGYCASSCPLVFAGGIRRIAAANAWIGVHQVFALSDALGSLAEGMDQGQRVSADAEAQLVDFGIDPRVWIHAMQTPKDKLYVFTPEELTTLKLATEVERAKKPAARATATKKS